MRYLDRLLCFAIFGIILVQRAHAVCIYKGKMYAKTTVSEEFRDSRWVVRAKVISAHNHWSADEPWTVYDLQVLTKFKGNPPTRVRMFTYRDSGGLYLDKGMNPDLGGEYLLFLDSIDPSENLPAPAQGATEVNYNCGQSEEWSRASSVERKQLVSLARNGSITNH